MKSMILAVFATLALAACAPINSAYNAALTQGVADYASAKQNIQATDDMKLKAFVDSSCAINIGALQRAVSTSGNAAIANGVFTLCPVPGVGVTTNTPTGTMQVQTFSIPITGISQPAAAPATTTPVSPVTVAPAPNPATARLFEQAGVSTLNLPTDLSPAQMGAIRQAVSVPIDLYIEVPDNFGGFIRYYEMPQIIRVAAPVYLKFGLRNAPDIYPSGGHIEDLAARMGRERVRRARIALDLLEEYAPEAKMSPMGSKDLGIPEV